MYHVNVCSLLENHQFSQHRPQEVMPKKCYHVNVFSLFFSTSPPIGDANKKLPCERIFHLGKWTISSTSPPKGNAIANIFSYGLLKIMARAARKLFQFLVQRKMRFKPWLSQIFSTSPQAVMPKKLLPCERIISLWKWPISSTSPPRGDAISNLFFLCIA